MVRIRRVRPYRASTTAGPVVVVADSYAEAMATLVRLGYTVTDLRGVRPVGQDRWFHVTSPNWWRAQQIEIERQLELEDK